MVTDVTTNNAPVLLYLKVPAQTIAELTARYEDGGEFGWYAWVEELKNFAYWDVDTEQWKEVNPQVYETYNSISNTDFIKGVGKKWSFQTIKAALYNYIYPLVQALHLTHTSRTDNPHSVTKAQVGLGNVDNTSDVNKPVSTAQKAYVDAETALRIDGDQALTDALKAVASGSPKGAYADEAALISDDPDHTYTYVTIDTGNWYFWNTLLGQWQSGGAYQAPLSVVGTLGDSETDVIHQKKVTEQLNKRIVMTELVNNASVQYEVDAAEYVGNSNRAINFGLGVYALTTKETLFNKIQLKIARKTSSGNVIFKLYTADDLSGITNPDANFTLLEEVTQVVGTTTIDEFTTVKLTDNYTVASGKYIILLCASATGISIKSWDAAGTGRTKMLNSGTSDMETIFDSAWVYIVDLYQVPFQLSLELPFILPADLTNYATKTELAAKIDYAVALTGGENVYTHERGDGEYAGNAVYTFASIGYQMKMSKISSFNKITLKASANSPSDTYFRVYKTSTLENAIPETAWTFIQEKVIALTSEMQDIELIFPEVITLLEDEYLVVLISTKTSTLLSMGRWNVDTYSDRNKLLVATSTNYSNIFAETWYVASDTFWSTPLKLDLVLPFITPENINDYIPKRSIPEGYEPKISIPAVIYAVVGTELNLWHDALVIGADNGLNGLKDYIVEITCAIGVQKQRCYSITPVSGNVGDNTLTIAVYDYNHNLIDSATTTLTVIAATAPSAVKNIVMIGDSLTAASTITQTVHEKFTVLGSNIPVFYGSKGTSPYNHEGIAGWKFEYFAGAGIGDGNPLWNTATEKLDIADYRSRLGMGTDKIDIVTIQLGINDCFGNTVLSAAIIEGYTNYAKLIIDAFLADNANTKVIIMLPSTDGNTYGGWGANYGAAYSKNVYQKNIFNLREKIITEFDSSAYDANVSVGIAGLVIDRYYGYALGDAAISARVATTEKVHTNAVHPTTSGYQQMGDAIYANILKLIQS